MIHIMLCLPRILLWVKSGSVEEEDEEEEEKIEKMPYSTVAQPPKRAGCFWIAAAKTLLESMA